MTNFEHKGTPIELLPSGKFRAVINGMNATAGSLAGIKSKIENAEKQQFKPFKALKEYWNALTEVWVVGVKPPRKNSWRAHNEFLLDKGDSCQWLLADTSENRALLAKMRAHKEESKRIDEERRKVFNEMEERLVKLDADEYAPKKPQSVE